MEKHAEKFLDDSGKVFQFMWDRIPETYKRKIEMYEGFTDAFDENDIHWFHQAAQRVSTGLGRATLHKDIINLFDLKMKNDDWATYFCDFQARWVRIRDRGIQAEDFIRAVRDAKFVSGVIGGTILTQQIEDILNTPQEAWPEYQELIHAWTNRMEIKAELTPKDREEGLLEANATKFATKRFKNSECFRCGETGHSASHCRAGPVVCGTCKSTRHRTQAHDEVMRLKKKFEGSEKKGMKKGGEERAYKTQFEVDEDDHTAYRDYVEAEDNEEINANPCVVENEEPSDDFIHVFSSVSEAPPKKRRLVPSPEADETVHIDKELDDHVKEQKDLGVYWGKEMDREDHASREATNGSNVVNHDTKTVLETTVKPEVSRKALSVRTSLLGLLQVFLVLLAIKFLTTLTPGVIGADVAAARPEDRVQKRMASSKEIWPEPEREMVVYVGTTANGVLEAHAGNHINPSEKLYIDSACNDHLWNHSGGLTNLSSVKPVRVKGITSDKKSVNHTGIHPVLKRVYVAEWASVSLISVPRLMDEGCKLCCEGNDLTIWDKNKKVLLKASRDHTGLFFCQDKDIRAFGGEIEDEEMEASKRRDEIAEEKLGVVFNANERMRAGQARDMHDSHGHMNQSAQGDACDHGVIEGVNLTRRDVDNSYKLFGPCVACIEGKMTKPEEPDSEKEPPRGVGNTLYMDMFFHRNPTLGGYTLELICVDGFSGYIDHGATKNKTVGSVWGACEGIVSRFRAFGHKVCCVVF